MEQALAEPLVAAQTESSTQKMQAVVYESYGPIEQLQLREILRPTPRADEVLVRVQAAALLVGDVFAVRGEPYLMRVVTGLFRDPQGQPERRQLSRRHRGRRVQLTCCAVFAGRPTVPPPHGRSVRRSSRASSHTPSNLTDRQIQWVV